MSHTSRRRRRSVLPAAVSMWFTVLFLAVSDRSRALRAGGDRGEQNTVSVVLWSVGALALALAATATISAWSDGQLSVFGGE